MESIYLKVDDLDAFYNSIYYDSDLGCVVYRDGNMRCFNFAMDIEDIRSKGRFMKMVNVVNRDDGVYSYDINSNYLLKRGSFRYDIYYYVVGGHGVIFLKVEGGRGYLITRYVRGLKLSNYLFFIFCNGVFNSGIVDIYKGKVYNYLYDYYNGRKYLKVFCDFNYLKDKHRYFVYADSLFSGGRVYVDWDRLNVLDSVSIDKKGKSVRTIVYDGIEVIY